MQLPRFSEKRKSMKHIAFFSALVLCFLSVVEKLPDPFRNGNAVRYSVAWSVPRKNSPLRGKTILFLGSSVTYGSGAKSESFADYLAEIDGVNAVKEAVSGTTLADIGETSYISRMKTIDPSIKADLFLCQLSTNDASKNIPMGTVSDSFSKETFDTSTVAGAIEYIIAYAKETWNCPVSFYTGTKYDSAQYAEMVTLLQTIAQKWDIAVLDLWNDADMNAVSEKDYAFYMKDSIHPYRAGYKLWWLPKFEAFLTDILA